MYCPESERLATAVDAQAEEYNSMRPNPLWFNEYIRRVLAEDEETMKPVYPYTVKIPKDNKYLLRGDYSPEKIITINEPIKTDDGASSIWTMNSAKRAYIRFGYKDCDPRYICDLSLSSDLIHCFLGGSSGQGKSVTVNSMINALCFEYAPWELELHMSDAKIAEFKKYGVAHRIPHIKSIAATEDAGFVISVLHRASVEMQERNKIFGACGVSNLTEFREKTGLALPRVLVVMDEVESTFQLAGKDAPRIANYIDKFARLGRSTGYHIFMATQNMSSDIPKSAMAQVRVRCCLGADERTSDAVLGNKSAMYNMGFKGKLIVNTQVLNGGKTELHNVTYQTPLLDGDDFTTCMEFLERKGRETGFKHKLSFYDEEDVKTLDEFDSVCEKAFTRMSAAGEITKTDVPICLGYPAFVTDDADELFKLHLDHKDVENILVTSAQVERSVAHVHSIVRDLKASGYTCLYYGTERELIEKYSACSGYSECRAAENSDLAFPSAFIFKRTFLLQMDSIAKNASYDRVVVESELSKLGIDSRYYGNERTCKRYIAYKHLMKEREWSSVSTVLPDFSYVISELEKTNSIVEDIDPNKFAPAAFIIGDMSKITGYGRDYKSQCVAPLKKAMQDASRVNAIFVLMSRSMEGLGELTSTFRYIIFDMPEEREYSRLRVDQPRELKSNLALLHDANAVEDKQVKFKRNLLHVS